MLKKIILGILVVVAVICALALTKPSEFQLQRTTTISAPREKVFGLINDFHNWPAWSPWEHKDPNMKRNYGGSPAGVGATYDWTGNSDVGTGKMAITSSMPPSIIGIALDFLSPLEAHNSTTFTLDSIAAGTTVTWEMHGKNNFMSKVMNVFTSMDKMVGPDFDSGLANLKAAAEK